MKPTALAVVVVLLLGSSVAAYGGPLAPNDPAYPSEWWQAAIGLPDAWGVTTGSPSMTLAILDAGVMANTPDLQGRVLAPIAASGLTPLDGSAYRHGTWTASVAAGGVNNGVGSAGVGNFSILPVTVTDSNDIATLASVAAGIRAAADAGARVINISMTASSYTTLNQAAAYARSKGALVFMPSGNSNARETLSGAASIIFVSGTQEDGARWDNGSGLSGSTWGPLVDLAAPAKSLLVAEGPDGYTTLDGTSFSSAIAAGAAALVWSANPNLTADQVQSILYSTATDLGTAGWDEVFGNGQINLGAAVAATEAVAVPEPATLALMVLGGATMLIRRRRHNV